jgi:hypothetical protein
MDTLRLSFLSRFEAYNALECLIEPSKIIANKLYLRRTVLMLAIISSAAAYLFWPMRNSLHVGFIAQVSYQIQTPYSDEIPHTILDCAIPHYI